MLTTPPLSLYVHLPWCVRKCPYCDFNSHEYKGEGGRGALPFDAYVDALIADLDHDLPLVWGRTVQTVFFGGGTPSLFPPDAIDRFLLRRWQGKVPDEKEVKRTVDALIRRGHSWKDIQSGLRRYRVGLELEEITEDDIS